MASKIQSTKQIKSRIQNRPDYKRIYTDLINEKYPEKKDLLKTILSKKNFTIFDVIKCNNAITDKQDENTHVFNQKFHSFDRQSILKILDYQKKHKYNNTQLAKHFKLSRNTVAAWKKKFI